MADLSPFATHFARLVWLCAQQRDDHASQKDELRNALAGLSVEPARLVLQDVSMAVSSAIGREDQNGAVVWFAELSVRMASHSVRVLEFDVATPAREVMALAQSLASMPVPGDGGVAFDAQLVELALTGVTAHLGPEGFVRRAIAQVPSNSGPPRTPALGTAAVVAATRATPDALLEAPDRSTTSQDFMQEQLMPRLRDTADVTELEARLAAAARSPHASVMVEEVARLAEERARSGAWRVLADVLGALHDLHDRQHDGDTKRAYLIGIRRLEKPALLQGLARLLPEHRELREPIAMFLARAGEAGADALIDLLINSDAAAERRAYRDALGQCPAAVGALLHLLGDDRWYVVRNAVELLGELNPPDVDARVAGVLAHRDPRVRRAGVIALGRLKTSRAVLALLQALADDAADVRMQAAHGIGSSQQGRAVPWLIEALDRESDPEVQGALLLALGKAATEDAVARLIRAAEPGGFLLRKAQGLRLRAIEALVAAGTSAATAAIGDLRQDRDSAVREAAQQAMSRLGAANGRVRPFATGP